MYVPPRPKQLSQIPLGIIFIVVDKSPLKNHLCWLEFFIMFAPLSAPNRINHRFCHENGLAESIVVASFSPR
jgi:hypothetical protein